MKNKFLYVNYANRDEEVTLYDLDLEFDSYCHFMLFSPEAVLKTREEWEKEVFERLCKLMKKGVITSYQIAGGTDNGKKNG